MTEDEERQMEQLREENRRLHARLDDKETRAEDARRRAIAPE